MLKNYSQGFMKFWRHVFFILVAMTIWTLSYQLIVCTEFLKIRDRTLKNFIKNKSHISQINPLNNYISSTRHFLIKTSVNNRRLLQRFSLLLIKSTNEHSGTLVTTVSGENLTIQFDISNLFNMEISSL